jgi:cell division protein FtsN
MKNKFSHAFYLRTAILMAFLIASIVFSFALGRKFGYFLMGDLQNDEKLMAVVDQSDKKDNEYSPLVSSRFKYNPDEFPSSEYNQSISERPEEGDVLEETARVEMTYAGSSESTENLFDLGEKTPVETTGDKPKTDDETTSNLLYKVLVGTFESRDNAENLYKLLKEDNYDPYIEAVVEGEVTHYRVQIGAFHNVDNANSLAEELRKKGYNAWTKFSKK